jgi:hypothetical protein
MGTIFIVLSISLTIIAGFAALQNYAPHLISKELDSFLTKETALIILLLVVFWGMTLMLRSLCKATGGICARDNEGFEDAAESSPLDSWKAIATANQLDKICSLHDELYKNIYANEKGAGDDVKPEAVAKANTEKTFSELTPSGTFDCQLLSKINKATDIDSFFVAISEAPSNFLVQAFESAAASARLCTRLLKQANAAISNPTIPTLPRTTEPFVNPNTQVCSPEVIEQRRKWIREKKLSEDAQACLLPEEVPADTKNQDSMNAINGITSTFNNYSPKLPYDWKNGEKPYGKMSIPDILTIALDAKKQLDKIKNKAESGEIVKDIKTGL